MDNDSPDGEEHRDLPLTALWMGVTEENLRELGFGDLAPRNRSVVGFMLANLLMAGQAGKWVSYSRNRNFYGAGLRRYEGRDFTYDKILGAVEFLNNSGLIEEERATKGGFGRQSRMRASARLLECASDWGPFYPTLRELIHLKDESKRRITYNDTDETLRVRRELERLNEATSELTIEMREGQLDLSRSIFVLGEEVVVPAKKMLFRCFNNSWTQGGRAYGGFWQNLPKELRGALLLDGCPVVEHDYAQLHPRLLYARAGVELADDAYTIEGVDRGVAKVAWQILMNSASRSQAIHALANTEGVQDGREARRLLAALALRHAAVSRWLYARVGLHLQYVDSQLLMRVLMRCLDDGIIALSVHDSLIVKAGRDADRAQEIMDHELRCTLKMLSASVTLR